MNCHEMRIKDDGGNTEKRCNVLCEPVDVQI